MFVITAVAAASTDATLGFSAFKDGPATVLLSSMSITFVVNGIVVAVNYLHLAGQIRTLWATAMQ
jgi:hypothetical protein